MQSTRERILQYLQKKPRSTINTLAEAVGINPISVRHHLTNLQIEGLVMAEEERHGVGRPRLVYLLTEHGMEHFPTRYMHAHFAPAGPVEIHHARTDGKAIIPANGDGHGGGIQGRNEGNEHG